MYFPLSPCKLGFENGHPQISQNDAFVPDICDKESQLSSDSVSLYIEVHVMGDGSIVVRRVVDIPYPSWFLKRSPSQPHLSYKVFAHEAICCTRVYECFYVGRCFASSDRDGNVHGSKSRSHYYRIEFMDCPHPGQWVQAF